MAEAVTLFEVGPRDGLQSEGMQIPTVDKVRLVDLLSETGLRKIEVTSFVSPKWVPQLADGSEVMAQIARREGVAFAALTPNLRGLDAAIEARVDEVAVFASASEGFSKANINCTIEESFSRFEPVVERAAEAGVAVRGYVSCVTDCPYDGPVAPASVARVAARLRAMGCYEVSLGDTIGAATPGTTERMLKAVLQEVPASALAGHFHDTNDNALANIDVSLDHGVRTFDASVGGLGGCPYAPGARGNVATERVVDLVERRGFATNIDRDALAKAAAFATSLRGIA